MPVGLISSALLSLLVSAPPPSGDAIAEKVLANYRGYDGQRVRATLKFHDAHGDARTVELTQLWLERHPEDGAERSLIRFNAPPELLGTALLTRAVDKGDDDVWLYLGKTRELKRIAGTSKQSALLGSQVSFEDLSMPTPQRYSHETTGSDQVDGRACWQVDRRPRGESAYSRIETCIDKERFVQLRLRFYDRAGVLLKEAFASKVSEYPGGRWRPHQLRVENVQTGGVTLFEIRKFDVGLRLSPKLFSLAQLPNR